MLLSKTVLVKSSKYYDNLGYNRSEKYITIDINHLNNNSYVKVLVKCDYCNTEKLLSYHKYIKNIKGTGIYSCSQKCSVSKAKITNLKKYGVENVFQSEVIKSKIKETNLEKYGFDNPNKSNEIKLKIKNTIKNKYGKDFIFQSDHFKNKAIETNLEKYGYDNHSKSIEYLSNTKIGKDNNCLKPLGDGDYLFKCDKDHEFIINQLNYHGRNAINTPLCTVCYPIGDKVSIKEKELLEYIQSKYNKEVINSYRDELEIDIYLPDLKLGFEFNGLYWHSNKYKNKSYHLDKINYFKEKGIRIIHIWEDDWDHKQPIIKSQILNLLSLSNKIHARKCLVKEITDSDFLNENHIQGNCTSIKKIGLYYNNELVSLMTFDKSEGRKKMIDGEWNLSRFCNILNTNVIGGASKLLSYFIKKYSPSRIISYADRDWSIGNLYYKLGFENIGVNDPDYKYIIDGKRVHKSRFRKSKLNTNLSESKYMNSIGIERIYDCGKLKFEKIL